MPTKAELATEVVRELAGRPRKEVIAAIIERVGMTPAGASTYFYNASKKLGVVTERQKRSSTPIAKSAISTRPATRAVGGINFYTASILPSDYKIDMTYDRFANKALAAAVLEHEALLASGMMEA